MAKTDAFPDTFRTLRGILEKHRGRMLVTADTDSDYALASPDMVDRSGKPLFVGAVQIKKNYVSLHFMPLYMNPALNSTLSPALQKRKQGKGCFNFTTVAAPEAKELSALIRTGVAGFKNLELPWSKPKKAR